MVLINLMVINSRGLITTLLQQAVEKDSSAYNLLKKKYLPYPKETSLTGILVTYEAKTHRRIVWVETKLKNN